MATPLRLTQQANFLNTMGLSGLVLPNFTMGPVPPGFVWTGTISISMNQVIAGQNIQNVTPHSDIVNGMQWTLYRNGQSEYSWLGLSALCNFQMFPNDTITVVGQFPLAGFSPYLPAPQQTFPLIMTYQGYSENEGAAQLQVPFLSTSVQAAPNQSASAPSGIARVAVARSITLAGATVNLLTMPLPDKGDTGNPLGTQGGQAARIWSMSLALSVAGSAGSGANISIQDALGNIFLEFGLLSPGYGTLDQDFYGMLLENFATLPPPLPVSRYPISMVTTVSGTLTGIIANAHIVYSAEGVFYSDQLLI